MACDSAASAVVRPIATDSRVFMPHVASRADGEYSKPG